VNFSRLSVGAVAVAVCVAPLNGQSTGLAAQKGGVTTSVEREVLKYARCLVASDRAAVIASLKYKPSIEFGYVVIGLAKGPCVDMRSDAFPRDMLRHPLSIAIYRAAAVGQVDGFQNGTWRPSSTDEPYWTAAMKFAGCISEADKTLAKSIILSVGERSEKAAFAGVTAILKACESSQADVPWYDNLMLAGWLAEYEQSAHGAIEASAYLLDRK
jgi:hypothetical protein